MCNTTQQLEVLTKASQDELALINARRQCQFDLTPVGQELRRLEANQRMGQMFAASTLVPDTYKANVANCAIACDLAIRMGANPLMVMQNLYIVHDNPSWSSKFLISTINTCGRFKPLKYRFFTEGKIGRHTYYESVYDPVTKRKNNVQKTFDGSKIDNLCCVAYTTERDSDELLESSVVSCSLAVQEGWWTKNQSKWPTMTQQMLMYRAAAFWARAYAPEISMGFLTVEESQDITDTAPVIDVQAKEVSDTATPAADAGKTLAELARENARRAIFSGSQDTTETTTPNDSTAPNAPKDPAAPAAPQEEKVYPESDEMLFS